MNDASEHQFSKQLFSEMLNIFKDPDVPKDGLYPRSHAHLHNYWRDYGHGYDSRFNPYAGKYGRHLYAGSFSEEWDALSLWRAYSRTGSRYAIGFRTDTLNELARDYAMKFEKVRYVGALDGDKASGSPTRQAAIEEIRDRILQIRKERGYGTTSMEITAATGDIVMDLMSDVRYKDEAFAVEKEWRIYGKVNAIIGASIGIAIFPQDGDTAKVLVKRADEAMYRAKKSKSKYLFAH